MVGVLDDILRKALEYKGSDVFIVPGAQIMTKASGKMIPITEDRAFPADIATLVDRAYELAGRTRGTLEAEGDDDFSFVVVFFPVQQEGGDPVHGEEAGSRVSVDGVRVLPEAAVQIQADRGAVFGVVGREAEIAVGNSGFLQFPNQQTGLGFLSGTVQTVQSDEHIDPPPE